MSSTLTAIQLNILGLGVVAGAHRMCIKARIPAPPPKTAYFGCRSDAMAVTIDEYR